MSEFISNLSWSKQTQSRHPGTDQEQALPATQDRLLAQDPDSDVYADRQECVKKREWRNRFRSSLFFQSLGLRCVADTAPVSSQSGQISRQKT
jgi:hypothetical protein